jgi:hypothetical protein
MVEWNGTCPPSPRRITYDVQLARELWHVFTRSSIVAWSWPRIVACAGSVGRPTTKGSGTVSTFRFLTLFWLQAEIAAWFKSYRAGVAFLRYPAVLIGP